MRHDLIQLSTIITPTSNIAKKIIHRVMVEVYDLQKWIPHPGKCRN